MSDKLVRITIRATYKDVRFKVEDIELKKTTEKSFIGYGERISKDKLNVISGGLVLNNHKWISLHCYCFVEAITHNKNEMLKQIASDIKQYEDEIFNMKERFVKFLTEQ